RVSCRNRGGIRVRRATRASSKAGQIVTLPFQTTRSRSISALSGPQAVVTAGRKTKIRLREESHVLLRGAHWRCSGRGRVGPRSGGGAGFGTKRCPDYGRFCRVGDRSACPER